MLAWRLILSSALIVFASCCADAQNSPPEGFTSLFNGRDLTGWHGRRTIDPRQFAALSKDAQTRMRAEDLAELKQHWTVANGELIGDGKAVWAATDRDYGDVELLIDFKLRSRGEIDIALRGMPGIVITDEGDEKPDRDEKLLVRAAAPLGEWHKLRILQTGARTSVWLNDRLLADHAIWQNPFDRRTLDDDAAGNRAFPVPPRGAIQFQARGSETHWRNLFVREISAVEANRILAGVGEEGFESIFNGRDLTGWAGAVDSYQVSDGTIVCQPGKGGILFTEPEYGDFAARLEFKLSPGGNNGLAIRYPGSGRVAFAGMCELQILDDGDPKHANIDPRQYHGSAYGMASARRGYLRPTGEWNFQEVTVVGSTLKVELNGFVVLDTDLSQVTTFMDDEPHPGKDLLRGHFGFAGHRDPVQFRKIRIKPLDHQTRGRRTP